MVGIPMRIEIITMPMLFTKRCSKMNQSVLTRLIVT